MGFARLVSREIGAGNRRRVPAQAGQQIRGGRLVEAVVSTQGGVTQLAGNRGGSVVAIGIGVVAHACAQGHGPLVHRHTNANGVGDDLAFSFCVSTTEDVIDFGHTHVVADGSESALQRLGGAGGNHFGFVLGRARGGEHTSIGFARQGVLEIGVGQRILT